MKRELLGILFYAFLTSCSINLSRHIDTNAVNIDKTEKDALKSISLISDTFLTLRKSDCQLNSDDYFITVYKQDGKTKSRTYASYGNYPKEPVLINFDWSLILNSRDSIKYQKPKPSYYGRIVEGDTTWYQMGSISSEQVWTFTLYTNSDTLTWETVSTERQANPSMTKTKISEYILAETYNKIWGMTELYGERKYKKKPIIGRR